MTPTVPRVDPGRCHDTVNLTFTAPSITTTLTFTLTVTGSSDATATDTVAIKVDATAPTANAGSDQTVDVGTEVTLDGSGSADSDSDIARYSWALTGDPDNTRVGLTNGNTASPTFTPNTATTLVFTLTVTDEVGNEASDTVRIFVRDTGTPTAEAGPDQAVVGGDTVTLDGSSSSDPGGAIATWQWRHVSGPTVTLVSATTAMSTFTAPNTGGDIVFELKVTDSGGNESPPDTVTITVDGIPTANAGDDQAVTPSTTVTLDGSGSTDTEDDEAGTALTYAWVLTASDPTATAGRPERHRHHGTHLHRPDNGRHPHLYPHGDRLRWR